MFFKQKKIGWAVIIFLIVLVMLVICVSKASAFEWGYEPIIVRGHSLPDFVSKHTNQLKVFAFQNSDFVLIPFQIDEKPFFEDEDGIFDQDDELVFLVRDAGTKAASSSWLDDVSSRNYSRYEIVFQNRKGELLYFYVFLTDEPALYELPSSYIYYESGTDEIVSNFFTAGFNKEGLFDFLKVHENQGASGQDFVDRLKMRLEARAKIPGLEYLGEIDFQVTEENLKKEKQSQHLGNMVRVMRRWNFKAEVPISLPGMNITYPFENQKFTFVFYPYWVEFSASLDVPQEVSLNYFRFSVDLNANSLGSKMICQISDNWQGAYPGGVLIDNIQDSGLNPRDFPADTNWWLVTGNAGTILSIGDASGLAGLTRQLYYKDASSGTNDNVSSQDTGDRTSWGDTGIKFTGKIDVVDLSLKVFFLPPLLPQAASAVAEDLLAALKDPLIVAVNSQVVPVELMGFTASINNGLVSLKWKTASESCNLGFEVERKSAGGEWQLLGFINGAGTTSNSQSYFFKDKPVPGRYFYRLKQIDQDGDFTYSSELSVEISEPKNFSLSQNYPNPFNPQTTIEYSLPKASKVVICVFNTKAQLVKELFSGQQLAGVHKIIFDGTELPAGVYFLYLQAGDFTQTIKMVLTK